MIKLAILASGSGTNAENIGKYFQGHSQIAVEKILSNKKDAGVHQRAEKLGIPSYAFTRSEYQDGTVLKMISDCDYVILAGFLWLIPLTFIEAFPNKIINIHPALLPNYGGKGMYGMNVHNAVIENGEKESGITIHLVNEQYDEGEALFQAKVAIAPADTPEVLASNIHKLEYAHFPKVIEAYVTKGA